MRKLLSAVLIVCGLAIASSAHAATLNNDNGGDGFVLPAPGGFILVGSDACSFTICPEGSSNTTTYLNIAATNLTVTYNWGYLSLDEGDPSFDPAGYIINGILHQLSDDAGPFIQGGVVTLTVLAGQNYGFYVFSTDQCCGPGLIAVASSPVPAALPLFVTGLGLLGWAGRRTKAPAAAA
jgi:hypothetical protein